MALGDALLRRITERKLLRALAFLALASSYGVTGVFLGHVEHYAIMSLGCFAYMLYAVRYLFGKCGILKPALALSLLFATHLMAAWLVPSLMILPWLRDGRRSREVVARSSRAEIRQPRALGIDQVASASHERHGSSRDLLIALVAIALPNVLVWTTVVVTYYEGSLANLFQDIRTGAYSWTHYSVGNALGGGNENGFLAPSQIASWNHLRMTLILFLLYSPFVFFTLPALLLRAPDATRAWLRGDSPGRFFLSLLAPYLVYILTWEADLGYERDWDLFSHVTIFALFFTVSLAAARFERPLVRAVAAIGLAASLALTGTVVLETHRSETVTGVSRVLALFGQDAGAPPKEELIKRRQGGNRP
jgi:hypothetical protein